jgi:SAM-dependent methyltransferase
MAERTVTSRAETIAAFHADLTGLPTWELAGWGSPEAQRARFDALLRSTRYTGGSVLDWGSGPGDLYFHLTEAGHPFTYEGIDIDPGMAELATSRGVPNVTVAPLNHTPKRRYDYVFASGIFQFQDPSDPLYFVTVLESMYDHSRRACAANFLSALGPESELPDDELLMDPATITRIAAAITDRWTLDHSYHSEAADLTVALHH